jgi:hypothetical protein
MTLDTAALRARLAAAVGDQLEIGDALGVGGSAAVFRGRDPVLGREVAVKVIDPALAPSSELETMFLQEARTVASVEHPNIVPLYSADSRGGLWYLVMRLLDGRSLASRLAECPNGVLPPAEAARIAHDVAQALATAHARGVVHRDIKPENVLLDQSGRAFVTDFGIAHVMTQASAELAGVTSGTPGYMSPEQLLGEPIDGRTDVYATGVLLFEMLAGRAPFAGGSITAVLAQHLTQSPPDLTAIAPEVPSALSQIVRDCLKKVPAERPTAEELAGRLTAARTADALRTPAQVRRAVRRRRMIRLGLLGASGIVLLAMFLAAMVRVLMLVFNDGPEPALNAFYLAVPPALIEAARAEGSLKPGELVVWAYVPAGQHDDNAILLTDSVLIRRTPQGARRIRSDSALFDVSRNLKLLSDPDGYLIAKYKDGRRDTLYTHVTGVEALRISSALQASKFPTLQERDQRRR